MTDTNAEYIQIKEKARKMQRDTERMFGSVFTFFFAIMQRSVLRELGLWEEV